jgi:CPA2 family monovalent cation:H+ antiporter-2
MRARPAGRAADATEERFLARQVVLVGYGRVGREIAEALAKRGLPFVVAEQNREIVEQLRARACPAWRAMPASRRC